MADQPVRLTALLEDLQNGRISLADAAAAVRRMKFPRKPPKTPYQTRMASALGELEDSPPEGSFADVTRAFLTGRITRQQYETLWNAQREGERQQGDEQGDSAAGPGHLPTA